MMTPLRNWRVPLRLARRDAQRAWRRSLLVVAMIALPVMAVTAVDIVFRTTSAADELSAESQFGAADAVVSVYPPSGTVTYFEPVHEFYSGDDASPVIGAEAAARIRAVVGDEVVLAELVRGWAASPDLGQTVEVIEFDPSDPLTTGVLTLADGRWPLTTDEITIADQLLSADRQIGDQLAMASGERRTIVGVADTGFRSAVVTGLPGALLDPEDIDRSEWLVGTPTPVAWPLAVELAATGMSVTSRELLRHPPDTAELPAEINVVSSGVDTAGVAAVTGLVMAMALMEVVLLAGPAFAVGARRSQRSLALFGVAGATPRATRRVVLAGGVVIGGASAMAGLALGVPLGTALVPVLEGLVDYPLGPAVVKSVDLAVIGSMALASALLASMVPAWTASRRSIVAVLSGQRTDGDTNTRWPIGGAALAVAAVVSVIAGSRLGSAGIVLITVGALASVAAVILLIPVVLSGVARLAGSLPLPLRYATRDGARNRSRTVPSVAATAATVAGAVALAVAITSYERNEHAAYQPRLPVGSAIALSSDPHNEDWDELETSLDEATTGRILRVTGTPRDDTRVSAAAGRSPDAVIPRGGESLLDDLLVDDGSELIGPWLGLDPDETEDARQALSDGGVVVFTAEPVDDDRAVLTRQAGDSSAEGSPPPVAVTAPALFIPTDQPLPALIVPRAVADDLGLDTVITELVLIDGDLTESDSDRMDELIAARSTTVYSYSEIGYRTGTGTFWTQVGLSLLAAALMIGGTISATLLALADAGPDLATLSSIGASPRIRRLLGASYALVIGGLGAVLGAVVGLLPGIGASYAMADDFADLDRTVVAIPWLMIVLLVIGLPTVVAAVVAAATRSRPANGEHLAQLAR